MAKLNMERVMQAVTSDRNMGFCIACGAEQDGCEPDAREYVCEVCNEPKVYGGEELMMMYCF